MNQFLFTLVFLVIIYLIFLIYWSCVQDLLNSAFQYTRNSPTRTFEYHHYVLSSHKKQKTKDSQVLESQSENDEVEQLFVRNSAEERLPIYRLRSMVVASTAQRQSDGQQAVKRRRRLPAKIENPCLPSLLVIGTQKGGTTSWHVYLKNGYHPQFLVPQGLKETNFFNKLIERNWNFQRYLKEFPGISDGDEAIRGTCETKYHESDGKPYIRAESSPNYLVHPRAAERAHSHLPNAKILVLLRNPVSRLVSAFNMKWQERVCGDDAWKRPNCYEMLINETVTFQDLKMDWENSLRATVSDELEIIKDCFSRKESRKDITYELLEECFGFKFMDSVDLFRYLEDSSHILRSLYLYQLQKWFDRYPLNSFEIWSSEEFERNPGNHMKNLVHWLGLDVRLIREEAVEFKAHTRTYISTIPDDVHRSLKEFFRPHNEQLFRYLRNRGFYINLLKKHF